MRPSSHYALWLLGLADPTTQTTAAERDCLARRAAGRKRLVEIGVWHGITTKRLRSVMAADARLVAVDPFPAGRFGVSLQKHIAHLEVGRVGHGAVEWFRCTGVEAAQRYASTRPEPVDFVFIDGDHSYEGLRGDWQAWSPLVAGGGIVALHDSVPTPQRPIHEAGSVRYTAEVIRRDSRFELVDSIDSLTVLRRRSDDGVAK